MTLSAPRFHVLGELIVRTDSQRVQPPGRTVAALLGVLLLTTGEVAEDDRLLELAWGPGNGSRRALQCAASRLRAWLRERLGRSCHLERFGSGYRLEVPEHAVDLDRFRARNRAAATTRDPAARLALLHAALREWRGPVLAGRLGWLSADPAVQALERARIDCALQLADLALQLGRPASAVPVLAEVAAAAPYDEPLQARLIRLLYASGRPTEALRHAEKVRRGLTDELGVPPTEVFVRAHAGVRHRSAPPWQPPAQLPPDVADFAGRARELQQLRALLTGRDPQRSGTVPIGVVTGMAGVGKSALAVRAAHRAASNYPDGQLYADLRGGDIQPAEVLGWFLRALGVDAAAIPDSMTERTALYRTRLAGSRTLVVLDNADRLRPLDPLVPGSPGCAVLVTDRTGQVDLAGARRIPLGPLPPDEAVTLFSAVAQRPGLIQLPGVAEIVRLCGYLPLALRVAGTRLAARPWLTPEHLAIRLADETRRLTELDPDHTGIRASLEWSYRSLPPPHRRAFRLLGANCPTDFSASSAAAVLGATPETAQGHVDALVNAALLDLHGLDETGDFRYRFHDLVRLYARELAGRHAANASRPAGQGAGTDTENN